MYSLNYQLGNQNVEFSFNQITRNVLSFKGEFIEAAQICKEKANGRIVLCFSGGLDSELVCKALQYVGANFTAITFTYNGWYNNYDINQAKQTYDELNLPHRFIDIDIEHIIDYKIDEYHEQGYHGNNIYRYMQIEFIKKAYEFGDFPIICSGEQRFMLKNLDDNVLIDHTNSLKYKDKNNETGILISAGSTNVLDYMKANKLTANPYFLYTTPELIAAYQQVPIIDFSLRQKDFYSNPAMTYGMKNIAYHNVWPELRMRRKSNGFDNLPSEYQEKVSKKLGEHYKSEPQNFWLPLSGLRKQIGLMNVNQVI
jgi:hypothetical protein